MIFLAFLAFNFHSGISKTITSCLFLCFFTTQGLIQSNFCLKDHTQFPSFFFADLQQNMLGYLININSLCSNPVVLKKKDKISNKKCFFGPSLHKKGPLWATPKQKNNCFSRNNKSRSSAFRDFLFYQNIICFCQKSGISS